MIFAYQLLHNQFDIDNTDPSPSIPEQEATALNYRSHFQAYQ